MPVGVEHENIVKVILALKHLFKLVASFAKMSDIKGNNAFFAGSCDQP